MTTEKLKKPEDYIERNIKVFIENRNRDEFGVSHVQRICRIGYNQARHTIDEMLKREIIKPGENGFSYKFPCEPSYEYA